MNKEEIYFDYKKDNLADKFPGLPCEKLFELGILKVISTDPNNPNIEYCDIRNITVQEAVSMGIISE